MMKLGNKMIMTKEQFEYSLNAILYCMWLIGLKQNTTSINRFKAIFVPLTDFLTTKIIKKFHERLKKAKKNLKHFIRKKIMASRFLAQFTTWIFLLNVSVVYWSYIRRYIYTIYVSGCKSYMVLILPAIPIGIAFLPLNKAVYSHDKYIGYFKRFEKENEQWLKKWKLRTILFCIGGILIDILEFSLYLPFY